MTTVQIINGKGWEDFGPEETKAINEQAPACIDCVHIDEVQVEIKGCVLRRSSHHAKVGVKCKTNKKETGGKFSSAPNVPSCNECKRFKRYNKTRTEESKALEQKERNAKYLREKARAFNLIT